MSTGVGRAAQAWQRSDRPVVVAAIALVVAAAFTLVRTAVAGHGNVASFIMVERSFANPSLLPKGVPVLPDNGYDGQFFYRLALGPWDLHRQAFGVRLDNTFRLQRIGYPFLAWLLSFGQHSWVPATLVIVNIAAIAGLAFVGAIFARDGGRHALWGLLLAGYFGFVFSLSRDTAEAVAAFFLVAGLLAFRRDRFLLAAGFLAYGALTRETVLIAVAAIALARVVNFARRQARPGLAEAAWLTPMAAFVAWQFVVWSVIGSFPISQDTQDNSGRPITTMLSAVVTHIRAAAHLKVANDIWVVELVVLVFFICMGLTALRSTRAPTNERIAFLAYIIELLVLSPSVWNGVADLRSFNEVFVLAVLIVIASARRPLRPMAATLLPILALVMAHRIVSL